MPVVRFLSDSEGSRAFTRYRTIDIDMKKDLVKILEGNGK